MNRLWRRAVIGTVVTATLLSGFVAQPAQAQVRTATPAAVTTTVTQSAPASLASLAVSGNVASVPVQTAPGDVVTQRIPIGPILAVLRRLAAAAYNAFIAAVRAGWASFQSAWNRLPKAIRWALNVLGTQWDIYKALACWLGLGFC